MIKVYNNIIPFQGFLALTVWPFIFIRKKVAWRYDEVTDRHEKIHGEQQKEMLVIGAAMALVLAVCGCGWWSLFALPLFFWWYLVEWLIKWAYYKNAHTAYKNICFEREAYSNQSDIVYLYNRKPFAWFDYILKNG